MDESKTEIRVPINEENKYFECKFTVEHCEGLGGIQRDRRITFDGYMPYSMFHAFATAIKEVVDE